MLDATVITSDILLPHFTQEDDGKRLNLQSAERGLIDKLGE